MKNTLFLLISFRYGCLGNNIFQHYRLSLCPHWAAVRLFNLFGTLNIVQNVFAGYRTEYHQFVTTVKKMTLELSIEFQEHNMMWERDKSAPLQSFSSQVLVIMSQSHHTSWPVRLFMVPGQKQLALLDINSSLSNNIKRS